MTNLIRTPAGQYQTAVPVSEHELINFTCDLLAARFKRVGAVANPADTKRFLYVALCGEEHEVFAVMFLDTRHQVIAFEPMFNGTIDGASVHPREVVKRALALNAAAVIVAHNHPSGVPEPSEQDKRITRTLQEALNLVDVRVLDHVVVGASNSYSFAEHGLI